MDSSIICCSDGRTVLNTNKHFFVNRRHKLLSFLISYMSGIRAFNFRAFTSRGLSERRLMNPLFMDLAVLYLIETLVTKATLIRFFTSMDQFM